MDKILEDLKTELLEIEAYRDLQDESFNFYGTLITNDSNISEDIFYKFRKERIEYELDTYYKEKNKKKKKRKFKNNFRSTIRHY